MKRLYVIAFALTIVLYGLLPYALLRHLGGLAILIFWVSSAFLWIILSLAALEKELLERGT